MNAVKVAIKSDSEFTQSLGINGNINSLKIHGWIVDTSIEYDHEYFSGYLKVSLEEVIIALRDDAHLLNDPDGITSGNNEYIERKNVRTLYPKGFSGESFVNVINEQIIWNL